MGKKEDIEEWPAPKGMLGDKATILRKKIFLTMFSHHLAIITPACKATSNLSRTTYHTWRKEDSVFNAACLEIEQEQVDMVETNLLRNVRDGKEISSIFYLKSKAKDRGYGDDGVKVTNKIKVTVNKKDKA